MFKNITYLFYLSILLSFSRADCYDYKIINELGIYDVDGAEFNLINDKITIKGNLISDRYQGISHSGTPYFLELDQHNYNIVKEVKLDDFILITQQLRDYTSSNNSIYTIVPQMGLLKIKNNSAYLFNDTNSYIRKSHITEICPFNDNGLIVFNNTSGFFVIKDDTLFKNVLFDIYDFDNAPDIEFPGENEFLVVDSSVYYESYNRLLIRYNLNKDTLFQYSPIKSGESEVNQEILEIFKSNNKELVRTNETIYEIRNEELVKVFNIKDYPDLLTFDPDVVSYRIEYFYSYNDRIIVCVSHRTETMVPKDKVIGVIKNNNLLNKISLHQITEINNNNEHSISVANRSFIRYNPATDNIIVGFTKYGLIIFSEIFTSIEYDTESNFTLAFKNIYPNPSSDLINLSFFASPQIINKINLGVYNLIGEKLKDIDSSEISFNNSNGLALVTFSTSDIPKGYYYFVIKNNKKTISKPIIIK